MKSDFSNLAKGLLCALLIDGCGGSLGGNPGVTDPGTNEPAPGTTPAALTFSITDAPVEDARNVYISVQSLQIAQNDTESAWLTIPLKETAEIDLLALQDGAAAVLAAIETLPAGTYTHTRMILAEESPGRLIDKDGVEHALQIPSGSESGLKIQKSFTIVEGTPVEMTIDFDLRKSLKVTGNNKKYSMQPRLRMTDDSKSGTISGTASAGSIICVYTETASKDAADSCDNAVTSATVKNGKYKIAFLDAGTYDLRIFNNGILVKDVSGVVVASGQDAYTEF